MSTDLLTKSGNKSTSTLTLNKDIFSLSVENHDLLKSAYLAYLANGRNTVARTLTRGEVRGGGKKPWKQKGTGRARFGSTRNPIWRKDGIVFGPTGLENFSHKITTAAKQKATKQALSLKAAAGNITFMEDIAIADGKTKTAASMLDKIGAKGNILIAVDSINDKVKQSVSNLKSVKIVQANYLNVYDIINADTIIITTPALEIINNWLGGKK